MLRASVYINICSFFPRVVGVVYSFISVFLREN